MCPVDETMVFKRISAAIVIINNELTEGYTDENEYIKSIAKLESD